MTPEYVRARLDYDTETGGFLWRHCPALRPNDNARLAGTVAGTINGHGYRQIGIDGRLHQAHRLAWLIATGAWPADQIDHINGVRNDNRFANLRSVSHADNQQNRAMPSTNTSGHIGVYLNKARGKWMAHIRVDQRRIHLGCFTDISDAIAARAAAEMAHGYHENHGRDAQ